MPLLANMLTRLGRRCGGSVYAALVPVDNAIPEAASLFLEDVWRVAPWWVAVGNWVAVLLVCISPPLVLGRLACFPSLSPDDKERLLQRFSRVRLYPVRLLFSGVKGMALVAVLRDQRIRQTFTKSG